MLSNSQRRWIALCFIAAALLVEACARWGTRPLAPLAVPPDPVRFDGAAAYEFTRVMAEEFPDRVTGTPAARRAAAYLRAEFQKLGYDVATPTFTMWLHGEHVKGENVIAVVEGESAESVAVIAHYDSQFTSHQAAEDNASGTGVLLELAAVLHDVPRRRSLILVATDAEEWGMIGARELVDFLQQRRALAVISIDYLTAGRATSLEMACMGQFNGYTPLWLRQWVVASGRAQNVQFEQTTGTWEWIERAVEVSPQDQGPLLRAGIPALNLGTHSPDVEGVRARYHSAADVFRNFQPAAFQMMGSTVEQAIRTLDRLPSVRPSSPETTRASSAAARFPGGMDDFQLNPSSFMPGGVVYIVQILLFLPALLAGLFAARNFAAGDLDFRGWRFFEPVCWVIPLGLATLLLYALTKMNLPARYELYPATPKDPFLYHLPWALLVALAGVVVLGSMGLRELRAHVGAPRLAFAGQKRILFLWTAMVALLSFFNNPYAACLFLGPFIYVAAALIGPRGVGRRCLNAFLLIVAAAPFAALVCSFGREIYLGWRIVWYLVLQTAYGVWSPEAVGLFLLAAVLWVQLLRVSVLAREAKAREGST